MGSHSVPFDTRSALRFPDFLVPLPVSSLLQPLLLLLPLMMLLPLLLLRLLLLLLLLLLVLIPLMLLLLLLLRLLLLLLLRLLLMLLLLLLLLVPLLVPLLWLLVLLLLLLFRLLLLLQLLLQLLVMLLLRPAAPTAPQPIDGRPTGGPNDRRTGRPARRPTRFSCFWAHHFLAGGPLFWGVPRARFCGQNLGAKTVTIFWPRDCAVLWVTVFWPPKSCPFSGRKTGTRRASFF